MYMCVCVSVSKGGGGGGGGVKQQGREGRSETGEMEVIHTNSNTCPRL